MKLNQEFTSLSFLIEIPDQQFTSPDNTSIKLYIQIKLDRIIIAYN